MYVEIRLSGCLVTPPVQTNQVVTKCMFDKLGRLQI